MRILLDYRSISGHTAERGIGEYATQIANHLLNIEGVSVILLVNNINAKVPILCHQITVNNTYLAAYDIFHIIDPMSMHIGIDDPFLVAKYIRAKITTATFFDIIPIALNYIHSWPNNIQRLYNGRYEDLNGIDKIFAISEGAKKQYLTHRKWEDWIDNLIDVIPLGINKPLKEGVLSEEVRSVVKRPFILSVGGVEPHKNIGMVREIFSCFKNIMPDLLWVCVGSDSEYREKLKANTLPGQMFLGHISRYELEYLYKSPSLLALLFPSLIEGFGLPAYEAASFGANVLALDIPAMKGLADNGIRLLKCLPSDFTEALFDISKGDNRYKLLVPDIEDLKSEYNWTKTANRMVKVWKELLGEGENENV